MKMILLILMLVPIETNAAENATSALRAMMNAASAQQMQTNLTRTREIPRLRALCAAQLRKKYVPSACFEALMLAEHVRAPENWLVENCVRAVPAVHDLNVLHRLLSVTALPDTCHAEVQKRYDDLRYASETESPAALFESENVR